MGNLVIKQHNFEKAKKELKNFSEQTKTDLDLKKVGDSKDAGEFFWDFVLGAGIGFDHKVSGAELNDLTTQIQTHLHSINNTQIKLIKEFGQVYSALEALDKDYIKAILVSINATEETSKSIQETQGQIKKIVENQKRTLEELKKFKDELNNISHLKDIDSIWENVERNTSQITAIKNQNEELVATIRENIEETNNIIASLAKRIKYAYLLAGGAMGLAIIELILLLMKVI